MSALSQDEATLAPLPAKMVQIHEDWLYFHLSRARDARSRMERAHPSDDDYLIDKVEREDAIGAASTHFERLKAVHHELSPLLAGMVEAEGLS